MEKSKVKTTDDSGRVVEESEAKSEVALREETILSFWQKHDIFNKSLEKDAPNGDFVFYDGPPFATGLPHYGHILASTIKDAVPRFWTMNGHRVRRQWGWDCHGLPLENLIEKKLGLATKRDIEEYGVKNFNEAARATVMEYADDWKQIIPRMGRWADMERDYKTMDSSYTESVWWVFSELNKKGLVYEGFKSMHLCPRCGTTLSNFEVNQGYKDIKDIAVTVKLPLLDDQGEPTDTSLLVWTTTPWTLPGNMAAAVHQAGDYQEITVKTGEYQGEKFIVARDRASDVIKDSEVFKAMPKDGQENELFEIGPSFKGSELVGRRYQPPFSYWQNEEFAGKENAWQVYHADYVELEGEGTGAVHLAPAYGDEDMELAKANDIPIVHHVDESGRFKDFVTDLAGQLVKPKDDDEAGVTHLDADIEVVKKLKESGRLFKKENVTHSYPHCWRCDTPLLNYATTSWFVKVTDIKDKLVAENNQVHWVPAHVGKNRFGKWLEGARDWAVSRQRYWGAPLPIWRNSETKEYKVLGSLAELLEHVPKSGNQYFVMRHGEAESNVAGKASTNVSSSNSLTDLGIANTRKAAQELSSAKMDLIISSPFERAKQTAELVADELGMDKSSIIYEERVGELNLADMDGISVPDYHEFLNSGSEWSTQKPEGGESWADVRNRVGQFLYEIESQYAGKNILIVSHNATSRMLEQVASGKSLSGTEFNHDDEGYIFQNSEVRQLDFTPIPHNDNYELDFHRPYIDDLEVVDGDGIRLERVPDVFDCWFESGSMPYGQHHYPFALKEEDFLKHHYPADFIAEGLDQTRGWFYSLIVLGVALFGKSPFANVIVNGLALAEDGRKMSKSLQNYPDPMELVSRLGADSIRFYLLSSPIIKGEDLNFSEKDAAELQRKNIGRLHNVLAMYEQYAGGEEANAESNHVLDQWIVARLNELTTEVTAGYQNYELDRATRPITDFIDDLSVWYLRRSRDRLKGDDAKDKQAALATLRHVLQKLALVMAPVMPFYADYLWGRVKSEGDTESVHLAAWPEVGKTDDEDLLTAMQTTRETVSAALDARTSAGIKVRQPLAELKVRGEKPDNTFVELIRDEVNVKVVTFDSELPDTVWLDTEITPELKREGSAREFIRAVQSLRKEQGLSPEDRINLTVETNAAGKELLKEFMADVQNTVGADSLNFQSASGSELKIDDTDFTIEINKV